MAKLIVLVGLIVTILVDYSTAQASGSCITCNSNDLTIPNRLDCIHRPETLLATACANPTDSCYTRINELGHTIRGCFGTLLSGIFCEPNVNSACQSCNTVVNQQPCNNNLWPANRQTCHQCNHVVGDWSACETLQAQEPLGCPLFQAPDQCYTLRNDTQVVRGCLSSSAVLCAPPNMCNLCTGPGCNDINGATIPEVGGERTRCITCQSGPAGNLTCVARPEDGSVSFCSAGEQCFSRIINGETHRGCLNELPVAEQGVCILPPNDQCQRCQHTVGVNSCNNAIFPTTRLRCHDCFGLSGSDCANGVNSVEDVCSRFEVGDQCFVQRFLNGNVRRGCLSNLAECAEPGRCFLCGDRACNYMLSTDARVPTFNFGVKMSFSLAFIALSLVFSFLM